MVDFELCTKRIIALAEVIRENEKESKSRYEAYAHLCHEEPKKEGCKG